MDIEQSLEGHLSRIGTAPFLFVGSGLSRRIVNLDTWEELLRRFAAPLAKPFEYFYGEASRDLPRTAELIADAFYDLWWADRRYDSSRESFKGQILSKASCLKYEIATYLKAQAYAPGLSEQVDREIELLKRATVDGVITTNWDQSLEAIFPEFEVFIGQNQVLFAVSQGIAEIYKIHGCCSEPNSLVLTASDYQDFNSRNAYLAAKLLTIFVEHPVIFLGYSLSDGNVIAILQQIASCLTNDSIHKLKDRLIFVQRDGKHVGESFEASVTQIGGYALPITIIRTNDFTKIYRPLGKLKRRFPARMLRQMKEHVYDLVKSNDPHGKLAVIDIEDDRFSELDVVYGVGAMSRIGRHGYTPITRLDLLRDSMEPKSRYDGESIVREVLPNTLRNTLFVPVFKYLRAAGRIADDGTAHLADCHRRVEQAAKLSHKDFYLKKCFQREANKVRRELKSVQNVIAHYGDHACTHLPLLKPDQIDRDALREFIVSNMHKINDSKHGNQTYFPRLICFFDWLVNSGLSGE